MVISLAKINEKIIADMEITEQQKLQIQEKINNAGSLLEMVDWSTYVTPGTPGFIHGELLHSIVSGNGVDYTVDELIPAVNTLIKKPIYKVPESYKGPQYTTVPENLHKDPAKIIVGEVNLVKFKNGAINFLASVDEQTYLESVAGHWNTGSIEANFVSIEASNKTNAQFKPEFISFTGYLLLPSWATPGDPKAVNQAYEMIASKFNTECPSKMIIKEHKISLARLIRNF